MQATTRAPKRVALLDAEASARSGLAWYRLMRTATAATTWAGVLLSPGLPCAPGPLRRLPPPAPDKQTTCFHVCSGPDACSPARQERTASVAPGDLQFTALQGAAHLLKAARGLVVVPIGHLRKALEGLALAAQQQQRCQPCASRPIHRHVHFGIVKTKRMCIGPDCAQHQQLHKKLPLRGYQEHADDLQSQRSLRRTQRTRTTQMRGPARSASMSKSSRRASLAARPGTDCRLSAGGAPSCSAACADGRDWSRGLGPPHTTGHSCAATTVW